MLVLLLQNGGGNKTVWQNSGNQIIWDGAKIIECGACPCTSDPCSNCTASTTRASYTITFGGATPAGGCVLAECQRLTAGPVVVTQISSCEYLYSSPVTGCADFSVLMYLDEVPGAGFAWVSVSMGSGTTVALFKKSWTPPVDCGTTAVTGTYAIDFWDSGLYCDLSSLTCSVAL